MTIFGIIAVALTAMVQGGYFPKTYIPAAILMLIGICFQGHRDRKRILLTGSVWLLLIMVYVISAIYHGCGVDGWNQAGYMGSLGLCWFYATGLDEQERPKMYRAFVWISVFECLAGMCAYIGMPLQGVIVNQRFMGTFQYANATALFLAITLIMEIGEVTEKPQRLSGIRILQTIFLQLTFSIGGLICYLIGILICSYKKPQILFRYGTEFVISGLFSALLYLTAFYQKKGVVWICLPCLLIVFVSLVYPSVIHKLLDFISGKKQGRAVMLIMLAVEAAGVFAIVGKRPAGTAAERILQMKDGWKILSDNLLFGIRPKGLLNELQNLGAAYKVTKIHNSYLQAGIEAGVAAMILLIALLILAWQRIYKSRSVSLWKTAVLSMAVFHWMIDISFYFWAVAAMVIFCVADVGKADQRRKTKTEDLLW